MATQIILFMAGMARLISSIDYCGEVRRGLVG